jgi:DHA2 family multidrug resistance protein-like MFS transporter
MQGTARLLGQTAGAVVMALLFSLFSANRAPQLALGIGALLCLLAALTSLLHGRQAQSL